MFKQDSKTIFYLKKSTKKVNISFNLLSTLNKKTCEKIEKKLTQIAIRRLPRQHQRFRQMFAQLQDVFEMCLGLVVLAQFVVHYAQFVVDQRIFGT